MPHGKARSANKAGSMSVGFRYEGSPVCLIELIYIDGVFCEVETRRQNAEILHFADVTRMRSESGHVEPLDFVEFQ
jgi:hypothetical protein